MTLVYQTENEIENAVERKFDRLDRLYMAGYVDQDEYEARTRRINVWAASKVHLLSKG